MVLVQFIYELSINNKYTIKKEESYYNYKKKQNFSMKLYYH